MCFFKNMLTKSEGQSFSEIRRFLITMYFKGKAEDVGADVLETW